MVSCNIPCDNVTVAVVSLVFISLGHGFSRFALSVSEEVSLLQVITQPLQSSVRLGTSKIGIQTFLQAPIQIIMCLSGHISTFG